MTTYYMIPGDQKMVPVYMGNVEGAAILRPAPITARRYHNPDWSAIAGIGSYDPVPNGASSCVMK